MRLVTVLLVLLSISSCTDSSEVVARIPVPKNLLSQEKFTEILTEMVKLEGHVAQKYTSATKYHKLMVTSGDSLLSSFGIDKEIFESSIEYYGSRQELMQSINDGILDELNKELGELESK